MRCARRSLTVPVCYASNTREAAAPIPFPDSVPGSTRAVPWCVCLNQQSWQGRCCSSKESSTVGPKRGGKGSAGSSMSGLKGAAFAAPSWPRSSNVVREDGGWLFDQFESLGMLVANTFAMLLYPFFIDAQSSVE